MFVQPTNLQAFYNELLLLEKQNPQGITISAKRSYVYLCNDLMKIDRLSREFSRSTDATRDALEIDAIAQNFLGQLNQIESTHRSRGDYNKALVKEEHENCYTDRVNFLRAKIESRQMGPVAKAIDGCLDFTRFCMEGITYMWQAYQARSR